MVDINVFYILAACTPICLSVMNMTARETKEHSKGSGDRGSWVDGAGYLCTNGYGQ